MKWTEESIINFIENNGYAFIRFEKFNGSHSMIEIKCSNKRHNSYICDFYSFKRGARCRKCENEKRKTPYIEVLNYIESQGYLLLSTEDEYYEKDKIKIWCQHKNHKPYEVRFNNFKDGKRCKQCYHEELGYDYKYVKKYIESYGYKLLSKQYINNDKKLKVECSKGHIFEISFRHFLNGIRCPYCNMSSGEQEVARILDKYNVEYEIQYRFDDCKNIKKLPFDFKINSKTIRPILIEFDGDYHYKIRNGIDDFIQRKINDGIKNEYCLQKGIKLIRVPYWEFKNIEEILIKELNLNNM